MLLFAHLGLALATGRFMRWTALAYLALGSILPDLIDKPLSFTVPELSAGRTIAHTLIFVLLLAALDFYSKDLRLYSLCAGIMIHLSLDFIWKSPVVLFWPLLGGFPLGHHQEVADYIWVLLLNGSKNPSVALPELLGLLYLMFFAFHSRHDAALRWNNFWSGCKNVKASVQTLFKID
jgi:hypothetical protein